MSTVLLFNKGSRAFIANPGDASGKAVQTRPDGKIVVPAGAFFDASAKFAADLLKKYPREIEKPTSGRKKNKGE